MTAYSKTPDDQIDFDQLSGLTTAASDFTAGLNFDAIPSEVLVIAKRCIIDGLGVALAGTEQPEVGPLERYITSIGGSAQSRMLGIDGNGVPAHLAALWFATAGHAMDWDDTQLAEGPGRPYGLLMHPTMPPLVACLVMSEMIAKETGKPVGGRSVIEGFCAGFEVGCKVAEVINPDHYLRGFHTSGTIGHFAAAAAAAKMLDFDSAQTARALGLAASMASGVRAGFGTMTKPFHVGRAAENGVTAALLVRHGMTANLNALDGRWGYLAIAGPGGDPALVRDRFGNPHTMARPGVSIKPYPSGVLTHPSMDAIKYLMQENALSADDIESVTLAAGSNVLAPIRFRVANTALEGKFSFAFLLSAIIIAGRAGKAEFTDEFVQSETCQSMQRKVSTAFDQEIEDLGWDRIRSRVDVVTKDGQTISRWADENYRGSPHNPLSNREVESKFKDCAHGLLSPKKTGKLFDLVWSIDTDEDVGLIFDLLQWR